MNRAPIGIFDSGLGGLTVARAIYQCLPGESTVYRGLKLTAQVTDERRVRELLVEAAK